MNAKGGILKKVGPEIVKKSPVNLPNSNQHGLDWWCIDRNPKTNITISKHSPPGWRNLHALGTKADE
jgi:hypothetical protein